ncbi:MAG TPA: hypothetical protein ENG59_04405 [Chloroflexi bacterium]|nr:hypothetical protein [Chloroflexota bacterium]
MELWEKIKNNEIVGKIVAFFNKYTNVKPVVEVLQSAKSIQKAISIILRIFSIIFGIALFIVWIVSWRYINQFKFFGGVGYLIWQLAFLYAGIMVTKILYQRFAGIVDLPESEYVITPIIALMTVTFGEVFFIFLAIMSAPAMLDIWLAGSSLSFGSGTVGLVLPFLAFVNPGNIFLAGIGALIMFWVIGFLVLILSRLLTETVLALVSIANDASILRVQFAEKKK